VKSLLIMLLLTACSIPAGTAEQSLAEETTTTTMTPQVNITMAPEIATTTSPTTTTTMAPKPELPEAVVGGLVVSMGEPPASVIERYADFGGNVVVLWEAEEAQFWPDYPAIVWDPVTRTESPLELSRNVVAVQVGDEPWPSAMEDFVGYKPVPDRLGLPVSEYTNFSYWTPLGFTEGDMEPYLDEMMTRYQGDRIMVSEYDLLNKRNVRYVVLDYFRRKALERGQDYWQYLNGYSGIETERQMAHSPSDLAWSAFSGAVMGYTGHVWFGYQFSAVGHEEAVAGGGSIFYEKPGEWTETPNWQITATINKALLTMSERVADMTSTDVRWTGSQFGSDEPLLVGSFVHDEDGTEWWAILNSNHTYAGSDDAATVTIPFDAEVWFAEHDVSVLVAAGESVTVNAGWAILVKGDTHG